MSRTTKKAPKVNKANTSAQNKKANAATTVTLNKHLQPAQKEKSFQVTIERMQLALAKGKFDLPLILQRASDALDRIKKVEQGLKVLKMNPVSNYDTLKEIYLRDLSHLNVETFIKEAANSAARFAAKNQGKLSNEQTDVITRYFNGQARQKANICSEVFDLLIHKGAIKAPAKPAKTDNAPVNEPVHANETAPVNEDAPVMGIVMDIVTE